METRVRFAPSPTGFLHVGGLRTALYNYLYAKNKGGKCILRIEDTDRTRFVENAAENLVKSLSWAGVEFEESPWNPGEYGPYVQSERLEIYKKHAMQLIDEGKAYYAFDTSEELTAMRERLQAEGRDPKYIRGNMNNQVTLGDAEALRRVESGEPYVIRLLVPEHEEVIFDDIIRGEIVVRSADVDDQILMKSDGYPTYHLANIVDDHLMKISHVIRGEEWLPSTPKHVLLYKAFGWEVPEFAHLPLLLNKDKSKLSKRQGSVAVEDFVAEGYIRDAFVNFIALLGWNPTGDREIYEFQELIDLFRLDKVNRAGAVFDRQKLEWMNGQYLKNMGSAELLPDLKKELEKRGITGIDDNYLLRVINLFKERVNFVKQIPHVADYMFGNIKEYDTGYIQKRWKEDTPGLVMPLIEKFREDEEFTHDSLYSVAKEYTSENGIKLGVVMHPLRMMVTGKSFGAGMFETMEILGKGICMERFDYFTHKMNNGGF